MITPLYQPLGSSSHRLAARLSQMGGQKTTHTGTLDPMAEGVLVCLSGEERFEKEKFADWQKTYHFSILWGVSTDSHDLLGLPVVGDSGENLAEHLRTNLPATLARLVGRRKQLQPAFSARRLQGKSAFDLAKTKAGREVLAANLRPRAIEIFDLRFDGLKTIEKGSLEKYLSTTIGLVQGDFRQPQILAAWQKVLPKLPAKLILTHQRAVTSRRTYIRGLVRDLGQDLGIASTTFHILRSVNGPYSIADTSCLI